MNFMNVELFGETGDIPCNPTRTNTVIKTNTGWMLADKATWQDWKIAIVFPDNEKAEYFLKHFRNTMLEFFEGMIKDDYIVHIIHFKYPKTDRLYADQLKMTKDYKPIDY